MPDILHPAVNSVARPITINGLTRDERVERDSLCFIVLHPFNDDGRRRRRLVPLSTESPGITTFERSGPHGVPLNYRCKRGGHPHG